MYALCNFEFKTLHVRAVPIYNWADLYAPVIFLVWRKTLAAPLRNIKNLLRRVRKLLRRFFISLFFFIKISCALSRLEPCHIVPVTEK